jgi:serine phosphatase RsbU (regulator of sigma subunit)
MQTVRQFFPLAVPDKRVKSTRPLSKTFLLGTASITFASILASSCVSFLFETRSARREAAQAIHAKILEAATQAQRSRETFVFVGEHERSVSLCRGRAVAEILRVAPKPLDEARLRALADDLQLDTIDVVDGNGVCIAAWPAATVGHNYSTKPETAAFLPILDDPTLEIAQPLRESVTKPGLFYQFSAVARRDEPGLIEVGLRSERTQAARDLSDLTRFIGSFQFAKKGRLFVYQNNRLLNAAETPLPNFDVDKIPLGEIFTASVDGAACFAYAERCDENLFVGALPQSEIFAQRRSTLILIFLANTLLFLGVFALISLLTRKLIVDGIVAINRSLAKIVDGNLGERVDVATTREFLELSNGVNATVDALKGAIDEVKRRVDKELELARRIQTAALPSVFPPFPDRREFDIYAENRPMSSVGGDMFDYFFLDENRLFFYVADVSGHGVPAALFMMKTTALVKNLALSGLSLAQTVAQTNRYLAENNDASFVTAFFCVVDVATGRLEYVDAGHNPPFLREPDGNFREIAPKISLLLGVVDDAEFESATLDLAPGAALVLFTDGVTEAASATSPEQFGVQRALDALDAAPRDASALQAVRALFDEVETFAGGAERSDDVTVLCFRYDGPQS